VRARSPFRARLAKHFVHPVICCNLEKKNKYDIEHLKQVENVMIDGQVAVGNLTQIHGDVTQMFVQSTHTP
jgi:hypothetical protein